jgi:hypothetical protein
MRFWDVASWQPVRRLRRPINAPPSPAAFTADSRIVALELSPAVIHLVEVTGGRTLAKLLDPNHDRATALCFTPDGTRLMVQDDRARAMHIWDLRAIRKKLADLDLDWDMPPYPEAEVPLAIDSVIVDAGKGGTPP